MPACAPKRRPLARPRPIARPDNGGRDLRGRTLQKAQHPFFSLGVHLVPHLKAEQCIGQDGAPLKQIVSVLEHVADMRIARPGPVCRMTKTSPSLGCSNPATSERRVLLPHPLGPTMAKKLSPLHGQRDVLQSEDLSFDGVVTMGHRPDFDDGGPALQSGPSVSFVPMGLLRRPVFGSDPGTPLATCLGVSFKRRQRRYSSAT